MENIDPIASEHIDESPLNSLFDAFMDGVKNVAHDEPDETDDEPDDTEQIENIVAQSLFNVWSYGFLIHTDQHDARCMERDAPGHHTTQLDIKLMGTSEQEAENDNTEKETEAETEKDELEQDYTDQIEHIIAKDAYKILPYLYIYHYFNDWSYGLKIHMDQHDARCMERDAPGHHITQLDINTLYQETCIRDKDGFIEGAIVSPTHASFLWKTSCIAFLSSIYCAYRGYYDIALGPFCVFLTSINHWRNPLYNSWQRYLDLLCVNMVMTYQIYRAMNAEYMIQYYVLVGIGSGCYLLSHYLAGKNEFMSTMVHVIFHIIGNISNIVLYSGWIGPMHSERKQLD